MNYFEILLGGEQQRQRGFPLKRLQGVIVYVLIYLFILKSFSFDEFLIGVSCEGKRLISIAL